MERIKILLVDDVSNNAEVFKEEFKFELEDAGLLPVWIPDIDSSHSARRAIRDEVNRPIDVAMVDLCLTQDSANPDGASVLDDMEKYYPNAYVLLYTSMVQEHPGFKDTFRGQTNLALIRTEIRAGSDWSWKKIAQDIKAHLISVGRLSVGQTTYDQDDVGIMSVLEEVGRSALSFFPRHEAGARILRLLAFECLDGHVDRERDLNIEFLAAGKSGANVCRLVFSGGNQTPQSYVLKFGFDKDSLRRELDRNGAAVKALGQSPLMAIVGKLGSHKAGYHAITANFASDNAVPLKKWLAHIAAADEATTMAKQLLSGRLTPLFDSVGIPELGVDEWITLGPGRRLRTLDVIERYRDVLNNPRACGISDSVKLIQRLSAFVRGNRGVAGAPSELRKVIQVRSFGDLHSNNVLVQLGVIAQPVLIDASLYDVDHWSADHARLLVDLLLRVRNSGVDSMLWPPITDADEQVVLLCPKCQSRESLEEPEAGATGAFITQAVRQLTSSTHMDPLGITSEAWHWEWHVALARELLRQATYEDLTPPRACMGLILADQHLRIARELSS